MNDPRYPHVVEVPVPTKTQKYKRFAHEKRAKRTPGVKRVQTPYIMVTKWDVELANKKNKKVGRARDRANKYGAWNENRTDTFYEDLVNGNEQEQLQQRVSAKARREQRAIRAALSTYADDLFPVYSLEDRTGWPYSAWEAYGEFLEEEAKADEEVLAYEAAWQAILNSPEQIAINAANDAHNAQQEAQHVPIQEGQWYEIELDTEDEAVWGGVLTEIDTDTDDDIEWV